MINLQSPAILDVRTAEEFNSGHIPGAINIPLEHLALRIEDIKKLPRPVIAYCYSGMRSGVAVGILKQHGIREAVNGGTIRDMQQTFRSNSGNSL